MCDQDHFDDDLKEFEARGMVTRRQFGVLLGAGIAMMLPKVANAVTVTESEVTIKTPDGTADCYFVHPASGTAAAVLVWPDIFGLRPAFRQMGKRLAETGYSVLVVNPFYRVKKAPTADAGAATPIPQLMPLAQALNETTHTADAKAFIGWLDSQPKVAKDKKIGTQGYCMGGPIAFRTSAAVPVKGVWPVSRSYSTAPREYTSDAGVSTSPRACSGDMYTGVPTAAPVEVMRSLPLMARANPKSMSTGVPSGFIMTLAGFRSRCISPRRCIAASAPASCRTRSTAAAGGHGWPTCLDSGVPSTNGIVRSRMRRM